ncbi:MAG: glycosyltransferase family 2 protein [Planctomycetota bacterium]
MLQATLAKAVSIMPNAPRVLAVVPAYDEEKSVARVVAALRDQSLDVLVVDDGSSDRTAALAEAAGATVLRHPINLGYGASLQTGYLYALSRGYDVIVQLDADGQHEPSDARTLLDPVLAGEADVVMGSRFLPPPKKGTGFFSSTPAPYDVPWPRRLGQRLFGGLARLITGSRVTDPTTGYQALSARVLAAYSTRVFPEDYPDADMWVLLHRMGFRVRELPVRMYADAGASMHAGVLRPLYYIFKMTLALLMAVTRPLPKP